MSLFCNSEAWQRAALGLDVTQGFAFKLIVGKRLTFKNIKDERNAFLV